jgi:hypothetical protein
MSGILFTVILAAGLATAPAHAAGTEFSASLDRQETSVDGSVALKFAVRSEGANSNLTALRFNAPDFDVVNEYQSTYIESFYENGKFGVRNNRSITKVLRPRKQGTLAITGIEAVVDGETYKSSDLSVRVTPGGAGTQPPPGYGGSGAGLRGAGKRSPGRAFFLRAEVDHQKAYKGQQIIVSYYLYRQARVFNIQVDKFPVLDGFLREDLEMPVMGQRLDSEPIVLDGVPYERALLARYAAYPLKTGKLPIDAMSIRANYYAAGRPGLGDDEDDGDPFMNFFQQMAPQIGTSRSDAVTIEAMPLPEEGKPADFSGVVGEFTVTGAVDKYEVRANEPVTLTVKVEGRGNLSGLAEPKGNWPQSVELYESKGRAKTGRGGISEKIFELLLIPRTPGKVTLPPLNFSFFDPIKKAYVTQSTGSFDLTVGEPAPGSAVVLPRARSAQNSQAPETGAGSKEGQLRGLKAPGSSHEGFFGKPWWRWLYWLSSATLAFFVILVGVDQWQRRRRAGEQLAQATNGAKSWQQLAASAKSAILSGGTRLAWNDVTQAYESLSGAVYDAIDRRYPIGARGLSREELERILVDEKQLPTELWKRIDRILEYAEMVRFASSAGAVTEDNARRDLQKWVNEGIRVDQELTSAKRPRAGGAP